jgi:hypothetical protein
MMRWFADALEAIGRGFLMGLGGLALIFVARFIYKLAELAL